MATTNKVAKKTGRKYGKAASKAVESAHQRSLDANNSAPVSDDAVRAKTGKGWNEWFSILDAASATELPHATIVKHLSAKHGVPAWWTQSSFHHPKGHDEQVVAHYLDGR